MIDSFLGLRHHVVVGSHNDDSNIRSFGTASTHSGKRFMSRSIKERNLAAVFQRYVVSTDVLCDTTGFTGNHICLTDIVEQRSLTMVYVTHYRYDRSAMFQILFGIFFLYDSLCHFRTYIFCFEAEFFRHQIDCLGIQTLVNGNHHTDAHTSSDDLRNRNVHHACQLVGCHEFRQLQYFAFRHFLVFQLLHTVGHHVTFFLTVFRSLILTFGGQASQSFLYLLCYILFTYLLFDNRLFEAVFILILTGLLVIATLLTSTFRAIVSATLEIGRIVDVHFFLIDTDAFLLGIGIIAVLRIFCLIIITTDLFDNGLFHQLLLILTLFLLFFTFLPLFLFRFLLRTCRLVQRSEVYLSDDINLRYKLRLVYFKYLFFIFRNHLLSLNRNRFFLKC